MSHPEPIDHPIACEDVKFFSDVLPTLIVSSILVVIPLLHVKIPPLDDYINHLARMYVIMENGQDSLLSTFYRIEWKIIPNLVMDLTVPPLAGFFGIFIAGKLFLITFMLLVLSGVHAIYFSIYRRWSLGPTVAALFIYNQITSFGLVNFLFGIGVALWGIAFWISMHSAHPVLRTVVSLAFVLMTFTCHLAALGLYGLGLVAIEAWSSLASYRRDCRQVVTGIAVFVVPFAIVPILLGLGPTVSHAGTIRWALYSKAVGLWCILKTYSAPADLTAGLLVAAGALWAWRRGWLRIHPIAWGLIALALPLYLALPVEMMGGWGVDLRLPIGIVFILIGLLDWRFPTRRIRYVFLAAIFGLVVFRVGVVVEAWQRHNRDTAELEASLQVIEPGSKILVARTDGSDVPGLEYMPCLAMIERSSLVSLAFSHPAQQILTVMPAYRDIAGGYDDDPPSLSELISHRITSSSTPSGRIYWRNWEVNYDYLYLLGTGDGPDPMPDRLRLRQAGEHFRLYKILPGPFPNGKP